jgi:hypothetical protein
MAFLGPIPLGSPPFPARNSIRRGIDTRGPSSNSMCSSIVTPALAFSRAFRKQGCKDVISSEARNLIHTGCFSRSLPSVEMTGYQESALGCRRPQPISASRIASKGRCRKSVEPEFLKRKTSPEAFAQGHNYGGFFLRSTPGKRRGYNSSSRTPERRVLCKHRDR